MYQGSITDIKGIKVRCAQNYEKVTGCTAVVFDNLCTAGVDVRGGGPGTINTDILNPTTNGCVADCIILSGGSALGLESAAGAMRYLEKMGRGFDTGIKRIPMVSGAIIYDLGIGSKDAWPDVAMGYEAAKSAAAKTPQGSIGAGTGATIGKILQGKGAEKSGQGSACIELGGGLKAAALMVVNALGDVWDGDSIVGGLHSADGTYSDSLSMILKNTTPSGFYKNTTIGVVATNAKLTPAQAVKMAQVAHDGLAQAIKPVHTYSDGDTVFSVATGEIDAADQIDRILAASVEAVRRAIVNAVLAAKKQHI